jgi:hypothetical protein
LKVEGGRWERKEDRSFGDSMDWSFEALAALHFMWLDFRYFDPKRIRLPCCKSFNSISPVKIMDGSDLIWITKRLSTHAVSVIFCKGSSCFSNN